MKYFNRLFIYACAVVFTSPAYAKTFEECRTGTLGGVIRRVTEQVSGPASTLIVIMFGMVGFYNLVMGLRTLAVGEQQDRVPIYAIMRTIFGGVLTGFTGIITIFGNTLGADNGHLDSTIKFKNAMANCAMGTGGKDVTSMITNFSFDLTQPLILIAYMFSFVIGLFLGGQALYRFAKTTAQTAQQRETSPIANGVRLFVAAALVNLPFIIESTTGTLLGSAESVLSLDGCSVISYKNHLNASQASSAVEKMKDCLDKYDSKSDPVKYMAAFQQTIFYALIPFGIISIISSFFYFMKAGEGGQAKGDDSPLKTAVIRLIAGAIMLNMSTFACYLQNTFYAGNHVFKSDFFNGVTYFCRK